VVLLGAACSGGGDKSAAPEHETTVSTSPQVGGEVDCDALDDEADREACEAAGTVDCDALDDEADQEACEAGVGDPDADLPGADRYAHIPEDPFLMQRLLPNGVPSLQAMRAAGAQAQRFAP